MPVRLVISAVAIVVAVLALEDITTDTSRSFAPEWTALALCAAWFAVMGWRYWLKRRDVEVA